MAEILIVDDERMIRAGLVQLLSGAGFAVREARDGRSALAAVAERRPDLVLIDVMMPGWMASRSARSFWLQIVIFRLYS